MKLYFLLINLMFATTVFGNKEIPFVLTNQTQEAVIVLPKTETQPVQLTVKDLIKNHLKNKLFLSKPYTLHKKKHTKSKVKKAIFTSKAGMNWGLFLAFIISLSIIWVLTQCIFGTIKNLNNKPFYHGKT
jgi:ABC-type bacteriocin/lantibiotic exporter with double-glycine peptidase domain